MNKKTQEFLPLGQSQENEVIIMRTKNKLRKTFFH